MISRRNFCLSLAGAATLATRVRTAHAQGGFPSKPIQILVPFDAGTTTDILARLVAQNLSDTVGNTVAENRPGAGGTLAASAVAGSKPDGYTLLMGTLATQALSQSMMPNVPYDSAKDFSGIAMVANGPNILVVHKDVEASTLPELVALSKKTPEGLLYASAGNGTASHLAAEMFAVRSGAKLNHVPYKSGSQAILDLSAGRVPMMVYQVPALLPFLAEGSIKALATPSRARLKRLPDVPTAAEQGIEGYEAAAWFGVFGPAGMPRDIVDKLSHSINEAVSSPKIAELFASQGMEPFLLAGSDLDAFVAKEIGVWAEIVEASGAKVH